MSHSSEHPHGGRQAVHSGAPLGEGMAGMILVHGRGASATSILSLSQALKREDVSYVAPQAHQNTWYPHSFLAPLAANEPWLSSALRVLAELAGSIAAAGVPHERIFLLGFSQGACLASEFVARNPGRYGGLVALSGGLIGNGELAGAEPPFDKSFDYEGDLAGTPVFFGCSDVDPHIPLSRVESSADTFRSLGAQVTKRIYTGMGHTVIDDEIAFVRSLLADIGGNGAPRG